MSQRLSCLESQPPDHHQDDNSPQNHAQDTTTVLLCDNCQQDQAPIISENYRVAREEATSILRTVLEAVLSIVSDDAKACAAQHTGMAQFVPAPSLCVFYNESLYYVTYYICILIMFVISFAHSCFVSLFHRKKFNLDPEEAVNGFKDEKSA